MTASFIETPEANSPNGHYSQAVSVGGFLFVSAQLPSGEKTGLTLEEMVKNQTESILEGILSITKAAGGNLGSICQMRFYVTNLENWHQIDQTYAAFMGSHKPARSVVNVVEIKNNYLVMADAVCHIEK